MCVKGAIHSIDVPLPVVVTVTHDVNGVIVVIVVTVDLFLSCYTFCSSSVPPPFTLRPSFSHLISTPSSRRRSRFLSGVYHHSLPKLCIVCRSHDSFN